MVAYLEGREIDPDDLREPPSARPRSTSRITPVLCGSSFKNKGVQPLLDAVVDYLPSPLDVPPVHGLDAERRRGHARGRRRRALRGAGLQGHDRPVRRQAHLLPRLLGHAQRRLLRLQLDARTRKERISRLLQMHANHREDREAMFAGELGAAVGLKFTGTGDTLCDPAPADRPRVDGVPRAGHLGGHRAQDQGRRRQARRPRSQRLAEEDPTFRVVSDEETGQTIISGMGELHLEIIVDRLLREFRVDANVGQAAGRLPRDHPQARSTRS